MFYYFPDNYPWNMAFLSALDMGGVISELDDACRPLRELSLTDPPGAIEAWVAAWSSISLRVERQARADESEAHALSSAEKYLRSALYCLMAERQIGPEDPRKLQLYKRALPLFRRGIELRGDPTEFVEIPFRGGSLPALLIRAHGGEQAPCIIHWNGLDWIKEFNYLQFAEAYARRGIAGLFCDQPGSGGALRLHGLSALIETEQPAAACVDYLETRSEVDPSRIGIQALSMGGYYAPRAAAFENRLACCVALGAFYSAIEIGQMMRERGEDYAQSVSDMEGQLMWVTGSSSESELIQFMSRVTLDGVAEHIRCPLLIVHGGQDQQIPADHGQKTYDAAKNSPNRRLVVLDSEDGGVEHCSHDNLPLARGIMADWIADVLHADAQGRSGG